ncbi:Hypothetical protein A7982_08682 [Minicystis rosea]|nr:Hypothetical protein A7982_08682 [Minicystis rosea]
MDGGTPSALEIDRLIRDAHDTHGEVPVTEADLTEAKQTFTTWMTFAVALAVAGGAALASSDGTPSLSVVFALVCLAGWAAVQYTAQRRLRSILTRKKVSEGLSPAVAKRQAEADLDRLHA